MHLRSAWFLFKNASSTGKWGDSSDSDHFCASRSPVQLRWLMRGERGSPLRAGETPGCTSWAAVLAPGCHWKGTVHASSASLLPLVAHLRCSKTCENWGCLWLRKKITLWYAPDLGVGFVYWACEFPMTSKISMVCKNRWAAVGEGKNLLADTRRNTQLLCTKFSFRSWKNQKASVWAGRVLAFQWKPRLSTNFYWAGAE